MSFTDAKVVLYEVRVQQLILFDFNERWMQHQRRNCNTKDITFCVLWSKEHIDQDQVEKERLELEKITRLWRSLECLALLLLSILRFFLGRNKFGGFQNRQRPRCTTMPWNIWPSLVVLWGVCWMFINTPSTEFDTACVNSVLDDERLSLFVPNLSFDHVFTPVPNDLDHFLDTFEFENTFNDDVYAYTPSLNRQTWDMISRGSLHQNHQDQSSPRLPIGDCSQQFSSSTIGDLAPNSDKETNMASTPDCLIRQPHVNENQRTGVRVNNHPLASPPLMAMIQTSSRSNFETPLLQHTPNISKQEQNPPRNADDELICTDPACTNKTFRRHCDWQTHVNKHRRPFRCSIEGCPRESSGFATKGVLDRHMIRIHQKPCLASSDPTRSLGIESTGGQVETLEEDPVNIAESFISSNYEKRKRSASDDSNEQETNETVQQGRLTGNIPKKVKLVIRGSDKVEGTKPNIEDLFNEVERLQQQLDNANKALDRSQREREKEREMTLGIIDRLTKQAK